MFTINENPVSLFCSIPKNLIQRKLLQKLLNH